MVEMITGKANGHTHDLTVHMERLITPSKPHGVMEHLPKCEDAYRLCSQTWYRRCIVEGWNIGWEDWFKI